MRALVTGGTGFIGGHLVRALVARGDQVRMLARYPRKARGLPTGVDVRIGDLLDPESLEGIADDIDVVFHLGAALRGAWERHRLVTVEGTRRLLVLAAAAGVRRFVHVSSLAVYDKTKLRARDVANEQSPVWEDLDICGPHARGKIEAEALVREIAERRCMEYTIARPGLVYGPGHTVFEHLGIRLGRGMFLPIGGAGVRLPLVHVDSVIDALLRLAESPGALSRTFNIVDDEQASKAEYLRMLSRHNCRKYRCIGVPVGPITAAARTAERLKRSGRANWLPKFSAEKIKARSTECAYDCSALRETTGWRPRHRLEEGVRRSLEPAPTVRKPAEIKRVGLIGAGRIAAFHIEALRRIPGIEVVGVMDVHEAAAKALAERHGIPGAYGDLERFYSEAKPESVHILTPPQSHAGLALDAIGRGVHVLLEKPMVVTMEECDRVREAAARRGVTVAVDHNYTGDPRVVKARKMIERGSLGELVHVDIYWAFDIRRFHHMLPTEAGKNTWATELPGGLLEDLLPHPLSLAVSMIDEDLEVRSSHSFSSGRHGRRFDDELRMLLAGQRTTANITLTLSASPDDLIVNIHGTRASVQMDLHNLVMITSRLGPGPRAAAKGLRMLSGGVRRVMQTVVNSGLLALKRIDTPAHLSGLLSAHYAALAAGRPLPTDIEHGRQVLEMVRKVWPSLSDSPAPDEPAPGAHRLANLMPSDEEFPARP